MTVSSRYLEKSSTNTSLTAIFAFKAKQTFMLVLIICKYSLIFGMEVDIFD